MRALTSLLAFQANFATYAMNVLRVASAVQDRETVTFGNRIFEVDTEATPTITSGRIRVDCSGGSTAAATQTLTLTGLPLADETVTIGDRVYTWKAALTGSNQVLIGADASASLDNLIAAVNGAAGAGTTYGTGTVTHAYATAAAGAGDTMVVTARTPGTVGNELASTETLTNGSWGAATFAGGVDPTAAEFTTALQAAADSLSDIYAKRISANEVLFVNQEKSGPQSIDCTETLAGANNGWAAATTYGGTFPPDEFKAARMLSRVPTAQEVTLQTMHFYLPFAPTASIAQVRSSAGAVKAFDGAIVQDGRLISVNSSGATDLEANDVVTLLFQ